MEVNQDIKFIVYRTAKDSKKASKPKLEYPVETLEEAQKLRDKLLIGSDRNFDIKPVYGDQRFKNGGARPNSGRKAKDDSEKVVKKFAARVWEHQLEQLPGDKTSQKINEAFLGIVDQPCSITADDVAGFFIGSKRKKKSIVWYATQPVYEDLLEYLDTHYEKVANAYAEAGFEFDQNGQQITNLIICEYLKEV